MKTTLKRTVITGAMIFMAGMLTAATDFDSLEFSMLDIDISPRAVGMAGAFTALVNDSAAVYYNAAGLASIKQVEINGSFDKWLDDAYFTYGTFAVPVGFGTIGGMFVYTAFGTFTERDDYGFPGNDINPNNIYGGLSYGLPIGDMFSFGLGVKFSAMNIDDLSVTDVLFDAGIKGRFIEMINLGISMQNVDTAFTPGYNIRAGIGINALKMDGTSVDVEFDVKYNSLDTAVSGNFVDGLTYSAGLEAVLFKVLTIRGGYNIRNENTLLGGGISGLSVGAGVTLEKISFDYAFTSRGDLGMTHLAGIKFIYEGSEEKEKKNYQKLTEFLAYQSYKDGEEAFEKGSYNRALAYWEEVKSMMPEYEGLDASMAKVKAIIASGGSIKKIEQLFNAGMKAYENFEFDKAVKSWTEVKKIYPSYKDIDVWLADAKELKASKGMSKIAEKYFREGIKYYNNCDYDKAITSWEKGLAKDPKNKKIEQLIDRTRAKRLEIREGISKAKADVANDATVIAGIKRLRDISSVCPAYQDAADILSTLKGLIAVKTRDYYFKGIEKYTEGNLDAAIIYWTNIESLDPKSEYLIKVKRYITDARNKQKAIKGFEQKKKK